jgi:hypothetical protein
MAASYFDDDFGDDNHDLSMGEDDETMLFLSQHDKDTYDASTANSTTEATASMMDAFDITFAMGDAQLKSQEQSARNSAYTAEPLSTSQHGTRGGTSSDTIDDFFDESYVAGRRASPALKADMTRFISPAARRSPTYADVFTADITTLAESDAHEERIYQTDYTPKAICENIQRLLTTTAKTAPIVNFQV